MCGACVSFNISVHVSEHIDHMKVIKNHQAGFPNRLMEKKNVIKYFSFSGVRSYHYDVTFKLKIS